MLGVAYKKDVDDPRESPSFVLMELLLRSAARCSATTTRTCPRCPRCGTTTCRSMTSEPLTPEFLAAAGLRADRHRPHCAYDYDFIVQHAPLVVDTRNATKNVREHREKIVKT